ncbi:UNVERIFIED_CONTAM: Cinnamoyl-CoA reductase 1 [Sesamum angustifolium]|uniref:Dihydroflavonol 4-reductase n=1 Tax=Sesamum angustifolium TaxID=2727405 RepID=A0AAW2QAX8_9LAMI
MVSENPSGTRVHHYPPLHIPRLRPFSPLFPTGRYQPHRQPDRAPRQPPRRRSRGQGRGGVRRGWGLPRGVALHARGPVDPQTELLEPAVKGTLNMLAAAKKFGVRRVVLTSSISAMVPNPGWPTGKVFDESSWTDLDYCKSRQKWYPVSKTLAEKAAWEFAKENKVDVVAINPATCLGQLLQSGLNASCAVLQQLLQGSKDTQEYHWLGAVHVKDVATAQILLFETPTASGRYLCTNGIYQFGDFAEKIFKLFPEFPVHRFVGETQPGLVDCEDAAKRLIDLGLKFTPVEDAVRDTVFSLKAKGFLGQEKPSS